MNSEPIPISLLQSIPLFSDVSPDHLGQIAKIATIRTIRDGDEIFHEGDPQDYLYIVLEGRIALEMLVPHRGRLRFLTIEPMEVLGWSSMADVSPRRTASACTVSSGKLLAIDAGKLFKLCQADPVLGFVVMHHVANVIANRLIITRMQLLDMFAEPSSEASHG
jgi:CRP-like cAMP-binding protein